VTDLIDRQDLIAELEKRRVECADRSETYGDKNPNDEDDWERFAEHYSDMINLVRGQPSAMTMTIVRPVPIPPPPIDPPEPEEGETMWLNRYTCPECRHEWTDEWPAQCDDDCPKCGCRHISPTESEEVK
jgi:hypothetical protein